MASDDHSQNCLHSNVSRRGYQDVQTIEGSALTNNSYLEEVGLKTEQKKENWSSFMQVEDGKKKTHMKC